MVSINFGTTKVQSVLRSKRLNAERGKVLYVEWRGIPATSGWQSPVVALDPYHAPIADLPMIRLVSLGIEPAVYRVTGKKGAAATNRKMSGRQSGRSRKDHTRSHSKSTDVAFYPLTCNMMSGNLFEICAFRRFIGGMPSIKRGVIVLSHGLEKPFMEKANEPTTHYDD